MQEVDLTDLVSGVNETALSNIGKSKQELAAALSPQGRKYIAPLLRVKGKELEGVQIASLSHHHLAIMDFMLTNPQVPMWAVASHFNRTQAWLSTVVNSDLFQAHFHERRQLMEQSQAEAIKDKLFNMASKGLDKLIGGLDDDEVSVSEKRAITRLGLEASGMLSNAKGPQTQVVVNNNNSNDVKAVNMTAVEEARQRILTKSKLANALAVGVIASDSSQ